MNSRSVAFYSWLAFVENLSTNYTHAVTITRIIAKGGYWRKVKALAAETSASSSSSACKGPALVSAVSCQNPAAAPGASSQE